MIDNDIERLFTEIARLTAERDEAFVREAMLALLFNEWLETPFFDTKEQWGAWVSIFRPRVENALAKTAARFKEEERS